MNNETSQYWNFRGKRFVAYKGQTFYTITPIPHYRRRRAAIVKLLDSYISQSKFVLDFGCGDGFYSDLFQRKYPDKHFTCTDISAQMLRVTKNRNTNLNIYLCSELPLAQQFDFGFSMMVLAHVDDNEAKHIFGKIRERLSYEGVVAICEQVAEKEICGDGWIRRTMNRYVELADNCGFDFIEAYSIAFPAQQWFERRLGHLYRKLFVKGETECEKRFNANKQRFFRAISFIFCSLTLRPVRKIDKNYQERYAYAFLVFRRRLGVS